MVVFQKVNVEACPVALNPLNVLRVDTARRIHLKAEFDSCYVELTDGHSVEVRGTFEEVVAKLNGAHAGKEN